VTNLLTRNRHAPADPDVPAGTGSAHAATAAWTSGSALATKVATFVLVAAIASGPVALAFQMVAPRTAPVVHASAATEWQASTLASQRAVELVDAWLAATSSDSARLQSLYPGAVASLPNSPVVTKDAAASSLIEAGEGVWTVVVGVEEQSAAPQPTPSPAAVGTAGGASWVRRYYQVAVHVAGSAAQVLSLPAPVAGPGTSDTQRTDYPRQVPATSALGTSVQAFVAAMVAGSGDVSRYTSPGVSISPITPAPYTGVTLQRLDAVQDSVAADNPPDGAWVQVLASVSLVRTDGQKATAQYALELRARAGRWEVTQLASGPHLRPASGVSTSSTP